MLELRRAVVDSLKFWLFPGCAERGKKIILPDISGIGERRAFPDGQVVSWGDRLADSLIIEVGEGEKARE